jgi:hypothetical protein
MISRILKVFYEADLLRNIFMSNVLKQLLNLDMGAFDINQCAFIKNPLPTCLRCDAIHTICIDTKRFLILINNSCWLLKKIR